MKNGIFIRKAVLGDRDTIVKFNAAMALETENKTLEVGVLKKGVSQLFTKTELGGYFIAERDGQAVGQLMITYEWSDWRNGMFWWIQSVYVPKEFRGQGIYKTLYEYILKDARSAEGVCGIRLYVDRGNTSAKEVYRRCGMTESHYDLFEVDFVLG